jgi:putative tricarboxylic transport membrane protein
MLGALMIQGITPGPQVMTGHPDLFWGASVFLTSPVSVVMLLLAVGFIVVFARGKKVIETSVAIDATENDPAPS